MYLGGAAAFRGISSVDGKVRGGAYPLIYGPRMRVTTLQDGIYRKFGHSEGLPVCHVGLACSLRYNEWAKGEANPVMRC